MHCVIWTYNVPPHLTSDLIENQFKEVAERYLTIPGLVRKYFCYSEDGKSVAGIYLWNSKEAAENFYTSEWMAGVKERWGAEPARADWLVPVIAESLKNKIVL